MINSTDNAWSMAEHPIPVTANVMIMLLMTKVIMTLSLFLCTASLCLKHLFLFLHLFSNSYESYSLGSAPLTVSLSSYMLHGLLRSFLSEHSNST